MATVGQFNKVWSKYSTMSAIACGLTDEAKAEITPLFEALSTAFTELFGVPIQKVDSVQQDLEFTGVALEALRVWVKYVDTLLTDDDCLALCGL